MAERRMMAKSITESDAFYDLPHSAQVLYLHLCQNADDDGFISKPKTVQRMAKCKDKDMTALVHRKFIIQFESGVVVIKHWRIHNYIKKDRHKDTNYKEELACLYLDENNAYSLTHGVKTETNWSQSGGEVDTQVRDRLGKDRDRLEIGKERSGEDRERAKEALEKYERSLS